MIYIFSVRATRVVLLYLIAQKYYVKYNLISFLLCSYHHFFLTSDRLCSNNPAIVFYHMSSQHPRALKTI
jgi:hypothetical protein